MLTDGSVIIVPAGARHNIINTSETEPLKLYTIYSPAHHKDGLSARPKRKPKPMDQNLTDKLQNKFRKYF